MTTENSVYTITYPSLYLPGAVSKSVFFVGMDESQTEKIKSVFENSYYETELVFYVSEKHIDEETLAWANAISTSVDYIIVNIDTINSVETALCLSIEHHADHVDVIYVSFSKSPNSLHRLHNYMGTTVFKDFEELKEFIIFMSEYDPDDEDSEDE